MGIISLLIKIDSKGPIFFYSERVGENSKIKLNRGNISNANIGIAVKDKSEIEVIGSKFSTNQEELEKIVKYSK